MLLSGRWWGGAGLAVVALICCGVAWVTFDLARRHLTGRVSARRRTARA